MQSLNHIVVQNKAANEIAYKTWIESHSPDQIRKANNARIALRTVSKGKWPKLHDPRLPKRPSNARVFFLKDRFDSGDFAGIKIEDVQTIITKEWNALKPSEQQVSSIE